VLFIDEDDATGDVSALEELCTFMLEELAATAAG